MTTLWGRFYNPHFIVTLRLTWGVHSHKLADGELTREPLWVWWKWWSSCGRGWAGTGQRHQQEQWEAGGHRWSRRWPGLGRLWWRGGQLGDRICRTWGPRLVCRLVNLRGWGMERVGNLPHSNCVERRPERNWGVLREELPPGAFIQEPGERGGKWG